MSVVEEPCNSKDVKVKIQHGLLLGPLVRVVCRHVYPLSPNSAGDRVEALVTHPSLTTLSPRRPDYTQKDPLLEFPGFAHTVTLVATVSVFPTAQ